MTSFLLLLIVGYVVAFFYTLNASIKNSRRLVELEKEVSALKAQVTAGVVLVAPEATARDAVASQDENAEAAAFQAEDEPEEDMPTPAVAAQVAAEDVTQEDAASAQSMQPATPSPTAAPIAPPAKESFESRLGARWTVWAGGLALALGGIFLVKYSIESGLLSPAVRLVMAAAFGLLLGSVGEAVRRKAVPGIAAAYTNAMIPGVLTAAGALTMFGVVYAAYGIYDYIGPTTAFIALALVAFATLGLSLLHGQALAGLGLFGSMVTPALVSTETPNIWALFVFLSVSWVATALAARSQRWHVVPALANIGMGLWALGYITFSDIVEVEPVLAGLLAMIAGAIWIWPGKAYEHPPETDIINAEATGSLPLIKNLLGRPPLALGLTLSMAVVLPAIALSSITTAITMHPAFAVAVLVIGLAALGAGRHHAVWPAIFAALTALGCANLLAQLGFDFLPALNGNGGVITPSSVPVDNSIQASVIRIMGVLFLLFSIVAMRRKTVKDPRFGALWAVIGATVPLGLGIISFVEYGNLTRDWLHAAYGLAVGCTLLGFAYRFDRKAESAFQGPVNIMTLGSFVAFVFTVHTLTSGLATTILIPIIGFAYILATRYRNWSVLPWVMALACVFVLGRIAWEPTIVGPQNLGTTPVFNALLPGYGIPALLAIASAWLLRNWPWTRARNFLQAIASLMGLLAIAILVRHAMNGAVLNDAAPTLGEQSIYTLLTIVMSGILMTLDLKSPSPIFRYGSMVAGVIAMANVLIAHFFALNPYFTGESTGPWPIINLLLIGYLLPGVAYAGLAYYARGKRPKLYVTLLALSGAALGFAWATLSVRRFWQGENIADWKGFLQGETYSYSVVWLAIGVLLLVLGSRFDAKSLRLASAALVLLAVAKAFLIDMSNLEGVLRALSFIGLGVVLIGIGLFYQKILTARPLQTAAQE
ncbi:DUF2339 domain-containing protein [Agrobacterium larrymoorei]|uniref:DUF2339 domain-containing protein n=1 Tax=Agrobacterium larrymoorei TaxID=160699 RepID=UPI001573EB66|nr:DUF2339 domain-containing protein [Agrobacterium larrymoorei]NTJ41980.1 DUF2339 domain-containing protein [Agrobacterium larrymoorei]